MELSVLRHGVNHLENLSVYFESIMMFDPDCFVMQARVELADQIRIEECRHLVERVIELLGQWPIGLDPHLDLRLADVDRGGRQQRLGHGLVNGGLSAPDLVENNLKLMQYAKEISVALRPQVGVMCAVHVINYFLQW